MEPSRREARSALAAALERGDVAAAGACSAVDVRLVAPVAGVIQGRKAIEDYRGTGIALDLSNGELRGTHVERLGAGRVEIGRYRVTVETEPTDARFVRDSYLALHRQAVDGTCQRPSGSSSPTNARARHHSHKE